MIDANTVIAENVSRLRDEIGEAAVRAGREPEEITLVGVSKTHPAEDIVSAIRGGLRDIGENRVQEAAAKLPQVGALLGQSVAGVSFHMIGHLQTNKAAAAVELFERVDSVDSVKLAQALSRRLDADSELRVLIEVYVGDDQTRPGVRPETLVEVVGSILEVPRLSVEGFMTIAPLGGDARAAFAQVRELKQKVAEAFPRVHFGVLSMGMSEDFREAIREGSTEVRIGTALFGPRASRF